VKQARSILQFLQDCARRGERTVLVTLTDVTGSATRAPGEHMAVAEGGAVMGSFSGGCVEAAVIAEAQEVLTSGQPRHVRYGAGSPYIDIRLPCGGGIDLLFLPDPNRSQIDIALDILERRRPLELRLSRSGTFAASEAAEPDRTGWVGQAFLARHDPQLRVVVLGHGAEPSALLQMAEAYGAETLLFSPQASLVDEARARGTPAHLLRIVGRADSFAVDPWSAVVTLFHDHDWETDLLLQALEQQPLFIGAMGSRRTHTERRNRLLEAGADPLAIDRVVGPVGLIAATRDPQTLAVSILAQVVQVYEEVLARKVAEGPLEPALNAAHRFNEHSARGDLRLKALH
jgi:xanthine dehydrogenase accessory factor